MGISWSRKGVTVYRNGKLVFREVTRAQAQAGPMLTSSPQLWAVIHAEWGDQVDIIDAFPTGNHQCTKLLLYYYNQVMIQLYNAYDNYVIHQD